ncbi:MAG: hypothetical protein WA892_00665 [Ornithinimicrobium sp.]
MKTSVRPRPRGRRPQGGPPLGVVAGVSTGLLIGGVTISALLGGVLPSPYTPAPTIHEFFSTEADAVRASGVLVFCSSVP